MKKHSLIVQLLKLWVEWRKYGKEERNISVVVFIASVKRYLYGDLVRVSTIGNLA